MLFSKVGLSPKSELLNLLKFKTKPHLAAAGGSSWIFHEHDVVNGIGLTINIALPLPFGMGVIMQSKQAMTESRLAPVRPFRLGGVAERLVGVDVSPSRVGWLVGCWGIQRRV